MGFCVAHTTKGSGNGSVLPSIVTCRSSIASSSADCVLGGVRLISSARRSVVKIGPLRKVNSSVCGLNTVVPTTSAGIRSGVNWMRANGTPRSVANIRTKRVFAVPGTPSTSTWPLPSSASKNAYEVRSLPTMTRSTPSCKRRASSVARRAMRGIFLSKTLGERHPAHELRRVVALCRGGGHFDKRGPQLRCVDASGELLAGRAVGDTGRVRDRVRSGARRVGERRIRRAAAFEQRRKPVDEISRRAVGAGGGRQRRSQTHRGTRDRDEDRHERYPERDRERTRHDVPPVL